MSTSRLHDLRSTYINFKSVVNLIKTGDSLDKSELPSMLQQLEKSLNIIRREISEIEARSVHEREDLF
jgi:hypothetical protein